MSSEHRKQSKITFVSLPMVNHSPIQLQHSLGLDGSPSLFTEKKHLNMRFVGSETYTIGSRMFRIPKIKKTKSPKGSP